jgi:VWFA-related protein
MRTGTNTGLVALILTLAGAISQAAAVAQDKSPISTIQTGTQLVVVDVVVHDKAGNPIHGLKKGDFRLTDSKQPQSLQAFEEHTAATPIARGPALPKMPPGTFTDYTPTPPTGALNIILLDALNTPMKDQSYVRYQMQQYVKHADPSMRIAIFGLATHLVILQSFTSDPDTLKDAVEHKLIPRASVLLDDPVNGSSNTSSLSDGLSEMGLAHTAANVSQFEAEQAAMQTQLRVQYTLDALHDLAHYLAAFPGRKNLVWFSGSFPIDILPDGSLSDPFAVMQLNEEEFRETSNMLARSQVTVYPVDARGLMTPPMFAASNSGSGYARNPGKLADQLNKFNTSQANEHMTMEQLATDTGGQAFYNTNGLAEAVKKAFTTGSNYYTLTYAPTDRRQNGAYRPIRIDLVGGDAEAKSFQLSYRHGYYADDPKSRRNSGLDPATTPAESTSAKHMASAYATAAMERGAPAPEDILFKVRVLPASTKDEPNVSSNNSLDPMQPAKGPFRRFDVDFATLPNEFKFSPQPDGRLTGKFEFIAHVYDINGRLLNATGSTIEVNLSKDEYKQFLQKPIRYHMEISVPVRSEAFLRLGIHDIPANHFGAVEIPIASVSRLSPPDYVTAPAPSASPSTQPPPATVPSTVQH